MIRLTNKENPYPDDPREHIRGGVHTAFNEGAKAQLKKMVEWVDEEIEADKQEVKSVEGLRMPLVDKFLNDNFEGYEPKEDQLLSKYNDSLVWLRHAIDLLSQLRQAMLKEVE